MTQVNLLIHLSMPHPVGDEIEPLFRQMGFSVYAVDRRISLPLQVFASLRSLLEIQPSCSPDIVMLNEPKTWALLCECKASSFGPHTSQAIQARTLFLLSGPRLGDHFGLNSLEDSLVAFVLPKKELAAQSMSLGVLSEETSKCGQAPTSWQIWGLSAESDGFYLSNIAASPCISRTGEVRVITTPVTISVTDLCSAIVLFVWPVWNPDSQKYLRTIVKRYVRDVLAQFEAAGANKLPSGDPDRFELYIPSPEVARNVRRLLLSSQNRKSAILANTQQPLPLDPDNI